VTRIEWDGTMQRRVVDTACRADDPRWEGLATRALLLPPPYHPVPPSTTSAWMTERGARQRREGRTALQEMEASWS